MACNDQLVIFCSIEVVVPGITCLKPLHTCRQVSWPRCHPRDQVIILHKVRGVHDAGFTEHNNFSMTTLNFPETSHRLTMFPCPRCHGGQFQNAVNGLSNSILLPAAPAVIRFHEPTGHRCNRFPCRLCHPGRSAPMSTEDDHDEEHVKISKEMQISCPKCQKSRDSSPNVIHSCASAGVPSPIVPMRKFPEPRHRCTTFPCPRCHGGRFQNAKHAGVHQSASGSSVPNSTLDAALVVMIGLPDENHDVIFKELINLACPQNVVLDSCASAEVPINPIVPMRTCPEPSHRCNTFPCPRCHRGRFQNAVNGVPQSILLLAPAVISFPEPSHRCTTFPCPRCHRGRFQKGGHHHGAGAIRNAIIPKSSFREPTRHRCTWFPCPLCYPGCCSAGPMSTAEDHNEKHHVISKELQNPCHHQIRDQSHNVVLDSCASAEVPTQTIVPTRTFPEPSHRCTTFPCPRCHGSEFQNVANVVPNLILCPAAPGVISFSEPSCHRCNRLPCPLCHPGRSAAPISTDEDEDIEKHLKISKELQNPCFKYQKIRDQSHNAVLESCASARVPAITTIVPMRTFPDPGHRCTEFPCSSCHRGESQNLGVIHSAGALSNPIPCKTHCHLIGHDSAPTMPVKVYAVEVDQKLILDFTGHLVRLFSSTRQLRQSCRKYQQACNLQPLRSALVHVGGY